MTEADIATTEERPAVAFARDPLHAARQWLAEAPHVALATVVATWGSSPVPVGGQMAILDEDRFHGSVSGGCVEADVIVAAREVMDDGKARSLEFGVSDDAAWRAGLACGGRLQILIVRLDRSSGIALLDRITELERRRSPSLVVTDTATGEITILENATHSMLRDMPPPRRSGLVETTGGRWFIDVRTPAPRVIVVGATHIAQHLAGMLHTIGYDLVVVDPRSAFTSRERFPGVAVVEQWPDEAFAAARLDPFTAVAAVSHIADIDDAAIRLALAAGCFYVGALGSRRSHERRRQRLAAAGVAAEQLDRIRAPIGLDIGAVGAAEIAVSIAAEIVAARRRTASP